MNNPSGIKLHKEFQIPYQLQLVTGKILSADTALLLLGPQATILSDSTQANCFVDGPMKKIGLSNHSHFLFPVGKGNTQRWLSLKDATGDFKVEFVKQNPKTISNTMGLGIDHISSIEYWTINALNSATASVELSFNDVNSGGVTDMNALRVAYLKNNIWEDGGNSAYTGLPGAAGSVVSNNLSSLENPIAYFTLASSSSLSNPLPTERVEFNVKNSKEGIAFSWNIQSDRKPTKTQILWSKDGSIFDVVASVDSRQTNYLYQYQLTYPHLKAGIVQLKIFMEDGQVLFSQQRMIDNKAIADFFVYKLISTNRGLELHTKAEQSFQIKIQVFDIMGRLCQTIPMMIQSGSNRNLINMLNFSSGIYVVAIQVANGETKTFRVFKQ